MSEWDAAMAEPDGTPQEADVRSGRRSLAPLPPPFERAVTLWSPVSWSGSRGPRHFRNRGTPPSALSGEYPDLLGQGLVIVGGNRHGVDTSELDATLTY
jgi:hypothetical protein